MKLREVTIKNFRCLVDVRIPLTDTSVLIGENNSGKTAFLEALRIALPRSIAGRQDPFDEYDYHMYNSGDSPEQCEGIVIELWFREDAPNEWPDSLMQALTDVIQTEPIRDLDSIGLRLSSKYDDTIKDFVTKWEFLEINGELRRRNILFLKKHRVTRKDHYKGVGINKPDWQTMKVSLYLVKLKV